MSKATLRRSANAVQRLASDLQVAVEDLQSELSDYEGDADFPEVELDDLYDAAGGIFDPLQTAINALDDDDEKASPAPRTIDDRLKSLRENLARSLARVRTTNRKDKEETR